MGFFSLLPDSFPTFGITFICSLRDYYCLVFLLVLLLPSVVCKTTVTWCLLVRALTLSSDLLLVSLILFGILPTCTNSLARFVAVTMACKFITFLSFFLSLSLISLSIFPFYNVLVFFFLLLIIDPTFLSLFFFLLSLNCCFLFFHLLIIFSFFQMIYHFTLSDLLLLLYFSGFPCVHWHLIFFCSACFCLLLSVCFFLRLQ